MNNANSTITRSAVAGTASDAASSFASGAAAAEDAVISLHDFGAAYDRKVVLEHINLRIHPNRITAVIGPSGCGKSTMLKGMNRMLDQEEHCQVSGSIHFKGKDIQTFPADELRRKIGMVFQTPVPFPMSIYKNMSYAPIYYGIKDKKELDKLIRQQLQVTGLYEEVKDELHKSALKLSGGQQQRLCIARALTVRPELLLFDEPCSALDVKSIEVIEQLLLELKKEYTIIIVTHNLFQARRIADHCIFMLNGQVWEQGSTRELFEHPQRRETQEYLRGAFA